MSIKEAVRARDPRCAQPLNLDAVRLWTIVEALAETNNNRTAAAKLLGINRSTLLRIINAFPSSINIDVEVAIVKANARPAPGQAEHRAFDPSRHVELCLCPECR